MAVEGLRQSDKKISEVGETPLNHTQLIHLHSQVLPKFEQIWAEGERNEGRWMGDNWNQSQRAKIRRQKRQAYSLAILASKLRYISATQKQLRTSYVVEPVSDPNDEIKAQLATLQMRAVENRSNAKYVDSHTFESGLAIKYGVRKVGMDTSSIMPRVKSYSIDWKNFVWDINAREYDIKKDALFEAEVEKLPRVYLERVYGKEQITGIAGQTHSAFSGRNKLSYFVNFVKDASAPKPYDMISLFKHCQKTTRTFYYVLFQDTAQQHSLNSPVIGKYKSEQEAHQVLRELNITNAMEGLPEEGEVIERDEVRIDYYEFTYNKVLFYEETDWEQFPYDVYFAMKFEDKFASYQDFLNDPQLIIDRMWAQIDYSLGKDIKNVYEGNRKALDQSETTASAERKASETGGIIWTKGGNDPVFRAIQSQGANPQWVNAIQLMVTYLEDMTGGRTFKGGKESGGTQSGKAISKLQEAGSVMVSAFLDSFNQFKKAHGENILWWIREYENEEDTIKVSGGALSPQMRELLEQEGLFQPSKKDEGSGFVTLNQGGISYLKDAEVELLVREEGMTETMREKRYNQLKDAGRENPLLVQSPTYNQLLMEAMDLGHTDKEKIVKEVEEIRKEQQEVIKQNQNIEREKNQLQYGKDQLDQAKVVSDIRSQEAKALEGAEA